jgi:hypothetical protein
VYSTCTTNIFENEGVIATILAEYGDVVELLPVEIEEKGSGISENLSGATAASCGVTQYCVKDQRIFLEISHKVARFWPHMHHTGGFFIAKLKKKKSLTCFSREKSSSRGKSSSHKESSFLRPERDWSDELQCSVKDFL